MNIFEKGFAPTEATLLYSDNDFRMIKQGNFVRCAISGKAIPLEELHYWSADRQEAYADAKAATEAFERYGRGH